MEKAFPPPCRVPGKAELHHPTLRRGDLEGRRARLHGTDLQEGPALPGLPARRSEVLEVGRAPPRLISITRRRSTFSTGRAGRKELEGVLVDGQDPGPGRPADLRGPQELPLVPHRFLPVGRAALRPGTVQETPLRIPGPCQRSTPVFDGVGELDGGHLPPFTRRLEHGDSPEPLGAPPEAGPTLRTARLVLSPFRGIVPTSGTSVQEVHQGHGQASPEGGRRAGITVRASPGDPGGADATPSTRLPGRSASTSSILPSPAP